MRREFWIFCSVVSVGFCVTISQLDYVVASNRTNGQKYPIICKNELGPVPKNVPVEKVDVNSDGLIDLIANYPWGGSALYINYDNGQYYRGIRSAGKLKAEPKKNSKWSSIAVYGNRTECNETGEWDQDESTLVDGRLYRQDFLTLRHQTEGYPGNNGECLIEFDGDSYKPGCCYNKGLNIYAPVYRFEYQKPNDKRITNDDLKSFYCELSQIKYGICFKYGDDTPWEEKLYHFSSIYFAELNGDGLPDTVLEYFFDDGGSAGKDWYASLLLNGGDNRFVFSGTVFLGQDYSTLKSRKIFIGGRSYTAVVNRPEVFIGPDGPMRKLSPENQYELYIYQPVLKEFLHITAVLGRDKSTFIPLDKKKFENVVNPLLLRNEPSDAGEIAKIAIVKLIEDYEKSLADAVNADNFSLVEKYLTPGSNLYISQKSLVAKLYQKKTREKLVGYKVERVKATDQANVYQVYVNEKIGIKKADKAEFAVSEFRWVYMANFDGTKYSLSDIAKWDGK